MPPETTLPDLKCKTANPNLQAFYYPWWATPDVDGQWAHWNHQVLPHWDERENKKYLIGKIHQVGFHWLKIKSNMSQKYIKFAIGSH